MKEEFILARKIAEEIALDIAEGLEAYEKPDILRSAWSQISDEDKVILKGCWSAKVSDLLGRNLPAPLFTRTVYSVADLHAQIDAIEALGFTSYVIGRDMQTLQFYTNSTTILEPPKHPRWIIKVYGEVTE